MTKSRDPNSKRSKKRAERNFKKSRPQRRAERRLAWAMGCYKPSDSSSNKPGALKYW